MPQSEHLNVRFDPNTVGWVDHIAAQDGMDRSTWIRAAVEREITRRGPLCPTCKGTGHAIPVEGQDDHAAE